MSNTLTKSQQQVFSAIMAALQLPQTRRAEIAVAATPAAKQARRSKTRLAESHPVVQIAKAKATKGRVYVTHLDVAAGDCIPDTTIACPNGAYAVLSISDTLFWMDRKTRTELANERPSASKVKAWRKRYPAVLKSSK